MGEYDNSGWWPILSMLGITTGVHIIRLVRNISRRKVDDWHVFPTGISSVHLGTLHRGSRLRARAVIAPLNLYKVSLFANPQIQNEQFPTWKEPRDCPDEAERAEAARKLRAQGWPLSGWVSRLTTRGSFPSRLGIIPRDVLMVCNGIQSNYISPFGFTVTDSKIVRPLSAARKYPIPTGTEVWALVIYPFVARGLRRIRIVASQAGTHAIDITTGIRVSSAIEGPPLVHHGRNVAHTIASSTGQRCRPNAVLWPVSCTRAAFSAVGLLSSGEVTFVAISSQECVQDVADNLLRLGVEHAVLCGGSADVQQWVHPHLCAGSGVESSMLVANSRQGSTNPGNNRRLNCVFVLTRALQVDTQLDD